MIFFGMRAKLVKQLHVTDLSCDNCGARDGHMVSSFSRHAHLYWIPMLPIGKRNLAECVNCKRSYKLNEVPPEALEGIHAALEVEKPKTPIWQFCGCAILLLLGLFLIGSSVIGAMTADDLRQSMLDIDLDSATTNPVENGALQTF